MDKLNKANKKYTKIVRKLSSNKGKQILDVLNTYLIIDVLIKSTASQSQTLNKDSIDSMYVKYDREETLKLLDLMVYEVYMKNKSQNANLHSDL